MFLEVELRSIYGSLPKPGEYDYKEATQIIRRQIKAELGWEVATQIVHEEGDDIKEANAD